MWQLRENIPVSLMQLSRLISHNNNINNTKLFGKLYKFDISLPLKGIDKFVSDLKYLLIEEVIFIIITAIIKYNMIIILKIGFLFERFTI